MQNFAIHHVVDRASSQRAQLTQDALFEAAQEGAQSVLAASIEEGSINVDDPDDHGRTLLFLSCRDGHIGCAQLLLNASASVNKENLKGTTPLYIACRAGHSHVISLLLNHDADPHLRNNKGAE